MDARGKRQILSTVGRTLTGRAPVGRIVIPAVVAALLMASCSSKTPVAGSSSSTTTTSASSQTTTSGTPSPGVTATSVTVGQVDDLTLPISGLFKGAEDGTQAYFDYINSLGGVNGRKIKLDAQDSLYSDGTVANATAAQIQKDFALVGGFSLDDAAEEPLVQAPRCRTSPILWIRVWPICPPPTARSPTPTMTFPRRSSRS